jgi:hypothetical protein
MNVQKNDVIFGIILFVTGIVFTGILGYVRSAHNEELAGARQLSEQYRIELDRATERIGELEAVNRRLDGHLRSASRNVGRIAELAGQTIGDTRAARALVAEIIVQVQSLDMELGGWRSGGGGSGDSGGDADREVTVTGLP